MAPQTRRRAVASSAASRVYHSSPAPQQQHFPARNRNIRTYGRAPSSARALRQQTLTQFDYLHQIQAAEEAEQEEMLVLPTEPEQSNKRRKTMGDTPSSSFHTQTLTQMLSEKGDSDEQQGQDMLQVPDSDDEASDAHLGAWGPGSTGKDVEMEKPAQPLSSLPQTPSTKRVREKEEILSSQPSPFTPMLHQQFLSPSLYRSPLTEKSTNVGVPLPTEEEIAKRSPVPLFGSSGRKLRSSQPAVSPAEANSQQPKRSALADITAPEADLPDAPSAQPRNVTEIPDSDDEWSSMGPSPQKSQTRDETPQRQYAKAEEEEIGTPTPAPRIVDADVLDEAPIEEADVDDDDRSKGGDAPQESATPCKGSEETHELEDKVSSDLGDGATPSPKPCPPPSSSQRSITGFSTERRRSARDSPSPKEHDESDDEILQPGTPTPKARRVHIELPQSSPEEVLKETPTDCSDLHSSPKLPRDTQGRSQYQSQGLESQRVPLEVIQAMGPQTDRSDVLVSMHPKPVDLIKKGLKNHEFRSVKIPDQVTRMWIYVTKPVMELQYLALVGQAKRPGEITNSHGEGNAAFNSGKMKAKFAHELLQVYQLNNPVSLQTLKENGWAENAPSSHTYLPPAAVGQLLGNLRCALFEEHGEGATVSQELQEQLLSDLVHSTQMLTSEALRKESDEAEVIPSTQEAATPGHVRSASSDRSDDIFVRPSLPAPSQVQKARTTARKSDFIRPSQATTASESSSPVASPEKSVPRPTQLSSIPSLSEFDDDGTPIRAPNGGFSLVPSSDILPPDSLVVDNIRDPPVGLWDSEDDEGGLD
ncbi:hypothetical protein GQ53DRAFT_768278 [Thozetella sp. PMI_491]|nr:hypothetical protein GQ53DRAFT_768278 [Thozetella sp. PMI_491]